MEDVVRGLVYGRFRSIRKFADAIGWNRTKACKIINKKQEPRVSEIQDMARVLEKPVEEVAAIFLQE